MASGISEASRRSVAADSFPQPSLTASEPLLVRVFGSHRFGRGLERVPLAPKYLGEFDGVVAFDERERVVVHSPWVIARLMLLVHLDAAPKIGEELAGTSAHDGPGAGALDERGRIVLVRVGDGEPPDAVPGVAVSKDLG